MILAVVYWPLSGPFLRLLLLDAELGKMSQAHDAAVNVAEAEKQTFQIVPERAGLDRSLVQYVVRCALGSMLSESIIFWFSW